MEIVSVLIKFPFRSWYFAGFNGIPLDRGSLLVTTKSQGLHAPDLSPSYRISLSYLQIAIRNLKCVFVKPFWFFKSYCAKLPRSFIYAKALPRQYNDLIRVQPSIYSYANLDGVIYCSIVFRWIQCFLSFGQKRLKTSTAKQLDIGVLPTGLTLRFQ